MAKRHYKIVLEAGAIWHNTRSAAFAEVGDEVEHDLGEDEERALVAAGWLEPVKKEKK